MTDIYIDTDEIKDFLYMQLIKKGLVPGEKELDEISDSMFEFLINKRVIDEV
ncbi:YozD family protein [Bacillus sp. MCCB 382]|uniref:YozD family protein n=1 Tax=Bacillus sp. MCCB 382 TaxID=2860197 RepID=UPI001C590F3F|nr:YozD family protein [Bacillus sp. MCCB 382]